MFHANGIGKAAQGEGRISEIIVLSLAVEGGGIIHNSAMNMRPVRMHGDDKSVLALRPAHGGFVPGA